MNWIAIAIIPPLLWAISNYIDKLLISKYFKGGGLGALLIFSSLIGTFLLPFIYLFNQGVLSIPTHDALLIVSSGIIYIISLVPYIYAMQKDEASIVATLFQFIPVFNYFLALFFLNEQISTYQILASVIIIAGATLISLDINNGFPKLKKKVFFYMLLSSFLMAVATLVFKKIAIEDNFWRTTFWEYVGFTIASGILFCIPSYRKEFLRVVKENKISFVGLNFINEAITITGRMIMAYASLLAPLALVWVLNSFQPLFVFLIGILATLFLPHAVTESLKKRILAQKSFAIIVMIIGAYLLNK